MGFSVFHQRFADPLLLVIGMNGNLIDMQSGIFRDRRQKADLLSVICFRGPACAWFDCRQMLFVGRAAVIREGFQSFDCQKDFAGGNLHGLKS